MNTTTKTLVGITATLVASVAAAQSTPPHSDQAIQSQNKVTTNQSQDSTRTTRTAAPGDANRIAENMRQSGTTLVKAIEMAERQLKGQAIDARTRTMSDNGSVVMDVTVVDGNGRVMVATVDVATGKVASTRAPLASEHDMYATGENETRSSTTRTDKTYTNDKGAHMGILKASDFKGRDVVNASNKKIGDIEELAIDEARGRVAYAIVDLDSPDRLVAVPWSALTHDDKVCRFNINGSRTIESAPAFEWSRWQSMPTDEFGQPLADYYGTPVYGRDVSLPKGTALTMIKLSDLVGMDIASPTGENLGEIEDLVLDPASGKISYAALSFGGFMGFNDKLFAVPWDALSARKDGKVIFAVDKERLTNAPGFDKKNWPTMASPSFDDEVRNYYKRRTAGASETRD